MTTCTILLGLLISFQSLGFSLGISLDPDPVSQTKSNNSTGNSKQSLQNINVHVGEKRRERYEDLDDYEYRCIDMFLIIGPKNFCRERKINDVITNTCRCGSLKMAPKILFFF